MSDEVSPPNGIPIPILWVGAEQCPVVYTNQMLGQVLGEEIFLQFGLVVPPLLPSQDPVEIERHLRELSHVEIQTVARFATNRERIIEMI